MVRAFHIVTVLLAATSLAAQPLVVTADTVLATPRTFDYIHVQAGAKLTFAPGAAVTLTGKDAMGRSVWINGAGAQLRFGTPAQAIPITARATLRLTDSSRVMVTGGGAIYAFGPDTNDLLPYTRLLGNITAGDSTLTVDASTGWRVGDSIAVTSTTIGPWECERRIVVAKSGNTLTVRPAFWYAHDGLSDSLVLRRRDTAGTVVRTRIVDARAYVANLTRPIQIYTVGEAYNTVGADIMVMAGSSARLRGAELRRLGMALPDTVPYNGGPTAPSYCGDQLPGRYSLHWHLTGNTGGDFVRNCTTVRSRNKSFNVHGAGNVSLEWNVTWHGFNHQFVLGEDGIPSEVNLRCTDNLAIYTRRVINTSEPWDQPPGNEVAFPTSTGYTSNNRIPGVSYQAETHPGAFMVWTPSLVMKRNVAACGTASVGFYFQPFMGRRTGQWSKDTAVLPPDFDFADQLDSTLILTDTPTFVGNVAFGFYPEANRAYGVIGDVSQDPWQTGASRSGNAYLSYRASGGGFWQAHGTTHMERDRIPWAVRDFVVYNCGYGIWNEYENQYFSGVWAFHNRFGANLLGGQLEDCFFSDSNYTGNQMANALAYSTAAANGYTDPLGLNLYQGYWGPANAVKRNYQNMGYPAVAVYNKDNSGGAKPARRPVTLHRVYSYGYPVTLGIYGNFEGPVYASQLAFEHGDTAIVVDWTTSPTDDGGTTAGWWAFRGTEGQASAFLTDTTRNALGAWDGLVYDLDRNRMIWGNGQVIDTCGGWVTLRLDDTKKVPVFDNPPNTSGLPAASPEPWYTTRSGMLPGPFDYPQRTLPRVSKQLYSATAIVPVGAALDSPATAFRVRAYGCRDGETVTVGGTSVRYEADQQPDMLNVTYLRGAATPGLDSGRVQNLRPTTRRPRLRAVNPAGPTVTLQLTGHADSINPAIFGVNSQGYFDGGRRIAGFTAAGYNALLDSVPIYGSRWGGTNSWANWLDLGSDTALGYGYRVLIGSAGDVVQGPSTVAQDQAFPGNNGFNWMRTATDSVPKLGRAYLFSPHPFQDSTALGLWADQFDSAGLPITWVEPVNEPYGPKIRRRPYPTVGGGITYGRWHRWVTDTVLPVYTARGITNVCAHQPPPDYFALDTADWNSGTLLRATWRDSAKAAYAGTLGGFSQLKLPCAVGHPYRTGILPCQALQRGVRYSCGCLLSAFTDSSYYNQLRTWVDALADIYSDGTDTAFMVLSEHNRENNAEGLGNSWFDGAHITEAYLAMLRINDEHGGVIGQASLQVFSAPRTNLGAYFNGLLDQGRYTGEIGPTAGYEALKAFRGVDSGAVYLRLASYTWAGLGDSLRLGVIQVGTRRVIPYVNLSTRPVRIRATARRAVAWELTPTGGVPNRFLRETGGQCLQQVPRRRALRSTHGTTTVPPLSYGFLDGARIP